jgi:hypothetical protein
MQYNAIQYNTIQYNTIQYNTIQYNTIQYNTIQYNTIEYNTIHDFLQDFLMHWMTPFLKCHSSAAEPAAGKHQTTKEQ